MNGQTESERPPLASRLRMLAMACPDGGTIELTGLSPDAVRLIADRLEVPARDEVVRDVSEAIRSQIGAAVDRKVRAERSGWFMTGWYSGAAVFWLCLTLVEVLRGIN